MCPFFLGSVPQSSWTNYLPLLILVSWEPQILFPAEKDAPLPLTPGPSTAPQHSVPSKLGATHLPFQGLYTEPPTPFLYRQFFPFHWGIPVNNYAGSHFKHFGINPLLTSLSSTGTITWTTLLDNLAVSTASSPAVHFFFLNSKWVFIFSWNFPIKRNCLIQKNIFFLFKHYDLIFISGDT